MVAEVGEAVVEMRTDVRSPTVAEIDEEEVGSGGNCSPEFIGRREEDRQIRELGEKNGHETVGKKEREARGVGRGFYRPGMGGETAGAEGGAAA